MKRILLFFIGIFVALFCLEALLQTSSLVLKYANKISNTQKIKNKVEAKDKNLIRILCIGESTTFAQYPKMLLYFLDKKLTKDYAVIDCGVPGTNIKNIAERITNQINYYQPDIVVTMMGINDAIFNKKQIYKKYPIKIFNLFFLIKRNIEDLVATKIYADETEKNYSSILDNYFISGEKPQILIDIVKENPNDFLAIKSLLALNRTRKDFANIEKYSKLFIEHSKEINDSEILFFLTDAYIRQQKFDEAQKLLATIIFDEKIKDDIKNDYLSKIAETYICFSDLTQTKKYYDFLVRNKIETSILDYLYDYLKTNNIDVKYYFYKNKYKYITKQPIFDTNEIKEAYIYIAKQIIDNNITYICMGYPTMSIQTFKNLFEGTDLLNKIYFVSNEDNFKEALNKYSYYQIFRDNFAGSFGHCTDYGNELIAKNLAETIAKLIE